jgi:hypothetical protein
MSKTVNMMHIKPESTHVPINTHEEIRVGRSEIICQICLLQTIIGEEDAQRVTLTTHEN